MGITISAAAACRRIEFTFRWIEADQGEGENFSVTVAV